MLFALLYLVLRRLFGLAGGSGSEDLSKDAEILILPHERALRSFCGWGLTNPRLCRTRQIVETAGAVP